MIRRYTPRRKKLNYSCEVKRFYDESAYCQAPIKQVRVRWICTQTITYNYQVLHRKEYNTQKRACIFRLIAVQMFKKTYLMKYTLYYRNQVGNWSRRKATVERWKNQACGRVGTTGQLGPKWNVIHCSASSFVSVWRHNIRDPSGCVPCKLKSVVVPVLDQMEHLRERNN